MSAQAKPAAPSAAPEAAAGHPAATPPATPSVTQGDPNSIEYYVNMARASLAGPEETPAADAGSSPAELAQEPPEQPANPPPTADAPGETPADEAEPTPEEQATWTEGEHKLHGALQKERQARKEARAELKELRATVAELQSKLETGTTQPEAPAAPTAETAQSSSPAGVTPGGPLEDCHDFEAIDARVTNAATMEARALRLSNTLTRQGAEAVRAALAKEKVEAIQGTPLAEASEEQIGDFLASVYEGARLTQAQAEPRKRFLVAQGKSFERATQLLPGLKDAKSEQSKQFTALLKTVPWLRTQGPSWPEVAATFLIGQAQVNASKPSAAKPNGTATVPALKSAPGAARMNAGSVPSPNRLTQLRSKLADGTASAAEATEYARLSVVG